jgi:hypothetical protein
LEGAILARSLYLGGLHPATGGGLAVGLSSPIAYLSSGKLQDVFAVGNGFDEDHVDLMYQNIDYWYSPGVLFAEAGNATTLGAVESGAGVASGYFKNIYGPWKVASLGPDKDYTGGRNPYDSTHKRNCKLRRHLQNAGSNGGWRRQPLEAVTRR